MPMAVKIAGKYSNRGINFEDLLDITISETVRAAHEYDPGGKHKQRFTVVVSNRLKEAIRVAFREVRKHQDLINQGMCVFPALPQIDLSIEIQKIITNKLTKTEQEAVMLRWYYSHTQIETSRLLGKSPSWIRNTERKARTIIRNALK